jgi:hypothetical protein
MYVCPMALMVSHPEGLSDYMSRAPWLKSYYQKYGFKETDEKIAWGSIDLIRMRRDVGVV